MQNNTIGAEKLGYISSIQMLHERTKIGKLLSYHRICAPLVVKLLSSHKARQKSWHIYAQLGTTNMLEWVHTTNKHQNDLLWCACMHRNQHC
jgi:hypothetical protein